MGFWHFLTIQTPNLSLETWNGGSTVTNHCRWAILYPPVSSNMAMKNTLFIVVIFSNEPPISSGFVIFLLKPPFLVDLPDCHVWWHRRVWGVLNLPGLRLWTAPQRESCSRLQPGLKKSWRCRAFKNTAHILRIILGWQYVYTYIHGVYIYIYIYA